MKSTEEVQKSVASFRQWLLDVDERLISRVVYQYANSDEIRSHLIQQDVSVISLCTLMLLVAHVSGEVTAV